MTSDAMIEIAGLHKRFGDNEVLKGISMNVAKGAVVALIGASGSGKSTLLRCINLLTIPDRGTVRVGSHVMNYVEGATRLPSDREQAAFRANTGMVFQHFNLFPHMSVVQNVMEGMVTVLRKPKPQAEQEARALLDKVGLLDKAAEYPHCLSGGQKQRVAIARALAMQPQVMLFDEATSALDPELVGEVQSVMRALADDGMTMIIVTHEISFAREVADEVVFMRDGIVEESGPAKEVIDNPQQSATKLFLSRFNGTSLKPVGSPATHCA